MKASSLWVFVITCLILVHIYVGQHLQFKRELGLTTRICAFSDSFSLQTGLSLQECVKFCHLRSLCRYVIYRHASGICGLTETKVNLGILDDANPRCVYTKPSEWMIPNFGECTTNSCSDREVCNPEATNVEKCSPAWCPVAPRIAFARVQPSLRLIGVKAAYFCDHGYTPTGNSSIVCLQNGTWSFTDFQCENSCPVPEWVDNAAVVNVSTFDYRVGSKLTIECKTGFINNKVTTITSTCLNNLNWNNRNIPCCRPDYTFSWSPNGMSCYILHEDTQFDTWEEISQFCKTESSTSSLFLQKNIANNLQLSKEIFETQNSTLDYIMTASKKSDMRNELLHCIKKSELNIHKHEAFRKTKIRNLLHEISFNTSTLSYNQLLEHLKDLDSASWERHLTNRLDDVINRLGVISWFNASQNHTDYDELFEQLTNETIDHNNFRNETYTELAYFIRNNSAAIPTCDSLSYWQPGYPNNDGDCILTGPSSNFTLIDVLCNVTDSFRNERVGFICWESQRKIQN